MVGRHKWLPLACLLLCGVALPCRAQSGAGDEYRRQISQKLRSNTHFPYQACGQAGEAKVAFTIDRAGKLMSAGIVSGTGVPALDEAALEMVKSAQPFPAAPPEVSDDHLEFVLPVIFTKPAGTSSCDDIRKSNDDIKKSNEAVRSDQRLDAVMRICRGC